MKDICLVQNNRPSLLVDIGLTLGKVGVNIEGLSHSSVDELAIVHFLVEDVQVAVDALAEIGIESAVVSDVFVFDKDAENVTGKSGSFGQICNTLVEHNLTIKFGYPAENNRFVFGIDDIEKATELLSSVS
ncbi:hypothetical protein [Photobacterium lutimaris]|uniref:Amino acid-binding protein n=1 Tax=Photobacterium lutimaris TaxID=388278 RepID=A0A2T3IGX0_9GAMM|nr:hypothetical protein [Photobacterium lutimaris]PSU26394.1 hypothetical protein C9I99_26830 [Photobacterium lutimaris]TDR69155.1 hypothetical protein DFP78_1431 [Photobacterium lutimaris]